MRSKKDKLKDVEMLFGKDDDSHEFTLPDVNDGVRGVSFFGPVFGFPEFKSAESKGDFVEWESSGLACVAVERYHDSDIGDFWAGYVAIPKRHPYYGLDFQDEKLDHIEVHGGLVYGADLVKNEAPVKETPEGYWWFGIDTAHHDSGEHWGFDRFKMEVNLLAKALKNAE